jgi:serine protease Do
VAILLTAVMPVAACVMTEGQTSSPTTATTAPAGSSSTPDAGSAVTRVDTIEELPEAVIQIETSERYRDPEDGWIEGGSHGSGFIIDSSGVALTNHHVVGASDSVKVWVGSDRTEYQANVVAVSECSDLAVLELVGGDGFAWLDWHGGKIQPGLEVYAAGFPLGHAEYTLTGGIVSRAHGVISEQWAWVLKSIEHDANILGGSSGGPVVTHDLRAVAVNYATNDEERRSFAISRDEVLPILPELRAGRSVASLGIHGEALEVDDQAGVWVKAVESDSPAANAGILPGDLVTELGGQTLAANGTMKEYCDVLRMSAPGDSLPFAIFRADDEETLTGAINGEPVQPGFAFATAIGGQDPPDPADAAPPTYVEISDAHGEIKFEVPDPWQDIVGRPWTLDGTEVGPGVVASIDSSAFLDGWDTAGVFVGASDTLGESMTADGVLDAYRFESCTPAGRSEFARGGFVGTYDVWEACDGTSSRLLSIAATPEAGSSMVYLQFLAAEPADLIALDRAITTLEYGSPP